MNKKEELQVELYVGDMISVDFLKGHLDDLWPAYSIIYHHTEHLESYQIQIKIHYKKETGLFNYSRIVDVSYPYSSDKYRNVSDIVDENLEEMINEINDRFIKCFGRRKSCIQNVKWVTYTDPIYVDNDGLSCTLKPHRDAVDSLRYACEYMGEYPSRLKNAYKQYIDIPKLKRVHSSGPVSVAIWSNGKKSMVRRQKGDKADPEKGILYAVIKGLCYEKGGTKEYSRVLDMIHEALEERKNG